MLSALPCPALPCSALPAWQRNPFCCFPQPDCAIRPSSSPSTPTTSSSRRKLTLHPRTPIHLIHQSFLFHFFFSSNHNTNQNALHKDSLRAWRRGRCHLCSVHPRCRPSAGRNGCQHCHRLGPCRNCRRHRHCSGNRHPLHNGYVLALCVDLVQADSFQSPTSPLPTSFRALPLLSPP